jgi:hypothetical protein
LGNTLFVAPAQNRRTGIAVMGSTDAMRASVSAVSVYALSKYREI